MSGEPHPNEVPKPGPVHPGLVGVIVVGTNDGRWLKPCFESLAASDYAVILLVYVDNGSEDESVSLVEGLGQGIQIIELGENLGFAGANNRGVDFALSQGASYVFLVNPDTRCGPELISSLVSFSEIHPEFGIIGPLQTEYKGEGALETEELNEWSLHAIENGERHVFYHWQPSRQSQVSREGREKVLGVLEHAYVQAAAMFSPRALVEELGFFNPIFHTFYEETDLCRRARWVGHRVGLISDLRIEHFGGGNTTGGFSAYREFHMFRNRLIFLLTDPEYRPIDVCGLGFRWFWSDVKRSIRAPSRRAVRLWILLKGLGSLFKNTMAIRAFRKENKRWHQRSVSISVGGRE